MWLINLIQDTIPAIPIVNIPPTAAINDWYTSIPLLVSGIIAIATLAIIPVIKALGEIKKQNEDATKDRAIQTVSIAAVNKQNEDLITATEEVHKIVNSNFSKQTEELRIAHEKIALLAESVAKLTKIVTVSRERTRRTNAGRRSTDKRKS